MRAPIHSQKHYVQVSRSTVDTVSLNSETLIEGRESTAANLVFEVAEGSVIKAVFVELWIENSSNTGSFGIAIEKLPLFQTPAFADYAALGVYDNKRGVFYYTQGLPPNDGVSGPVPVIRQWFKIPKGKQRFALGDRLVIGIANFGADTLSYCGFATYKEYS